MKPALWRVSSTYPDTLHGRSRVPGRWSRGPGCRGGCSSRHQRPSGRLNSTSHEDSRSLYSSEPSPECPCRLVQVSRPHTRAPAQSWSRSQSPPP